MLKYLQISVGLFVLLKLAATFGIYSIALYEANECSDRESAGLICYSCSVVAVCAHINGIWETIPIEECDKQNGYVCNVHEGGCSNRTGPCNNVGHEENFVCTSVGIFPDPYDCQRYHMCYQSGNSLVAYNVECGKNTAFSSTTGDCSLTLTDTVCQSPQFVCNTVGYQSAWPGNDNIFYICKAAMSNGERTLYPALYRCGSGEYFNGIECVLRNGTGTVTVPPPNGTFQCPNAGLYENINDCYSYYSCNGNFVATLLQCPVNTYFDAGNLSCIRGACPI